MNSKSTIEPQGGSVPAGQPPMGPPPGGRPQLPVTPRNSLVDEVRFLFSGQGMPYEKVCLTVTIVITVILCALLQGNISQDAPVAVIDLDNSAYSHELTSHIENSPYMHVTAVMNMPTDPKELCYRDKAIAVVYMPRGLEKDVYTGTATNIGVFYDFSNTALNSDVMSALNEIVGLENAAAQGDVGSTNDSLYGQIQLAERKLFNPQGSTSNGETLGFLFFFGSMFFTFATIGMVPRLRLTHQLDRILIEGTPLDIIIRLVPYALCLMTSFVLGLAILHTWGDLNMSGNIIAFVFIQIFYTMTVGMLSVFFGWTASNPGIASSRMILFIPGGFILGGATGPLSFFSSFTVALSHVFPLTWEFHFVRDIIQRGADLPALSREIGAFLLYIAAVIILFTWRFYKSRRTLLRRQAREAHHKAVLAETQA